MNCIILSLGSQIEIPSSPRQETFLHPERQWWLPCSCYSNLRPVRLLVLIMAWWSVINPVLYGCVIEGVTVSVLLVPCWGFWDLRLWVILEDSWMGVKGLYLVWGGDWYLHSSCLGGVRAVLLNPSEPGAFAAGHHTVPLLKRWLQSHVLFISCFWQTSGIEFFCFCTGWINVRRV